MVEYWDWKVDWYYWGQDRLGSLLPLVAWPFYRLGLGSFEALGLAQLTILSFSLVLAFQMFKHNLARLVVAVVLLYPIYPFWMQVSAGHPYLGQVLFGLLWIQIDQSKLELKYKALLLPVLAVLNLWVSELSLAIILAYVFLKLPQWRALKLQNTLITVGTAALSLSALKFAKSKAVSLPDYGRFFAGPMEVLESVGQQLSLFAELLVFNSNKPFNSLLAWGLLLFSLSLPWFWWKSPKKLSFTATLLLLAGLGAFAMIQLSHWNNLMGQPLRYYTYPYILWTLGLIKAYADVASTKVQYGFSGFLLMLSLSASLHFNQFFPPGADGRMTRAEAESLIGKLAEEFPNESVGLIASYWNSYLPDALSTQVYSMPRKGEHIRDFRPLQNLKNQKTIVLIRNGWLEELPDEITQFDLLLKRSSPKMRIGKIEYAYYQNLNP